MAQALQGHDEVVAVVKPRCVPWHSMIVGVDGNDGEGKSTLGRHMASCIGMPCV
jgi:hypothetical protein